MVILAWTVFEKFRPKPSEAVFSTVFFHYNLRSEVDGDIISTAAIDYVSKDVRLKFGDSRSNESLDIRGADFVSNERPNIKTYPSSAKHLFRLKTQLIG